MQVQGQRWGSHGRGRHGTEAPGAPVAASQNPLMRLALTVSGLGWIAWRFSHGCSWVP